MEKPQSGYSTHITKTPKHYQTYTHTCPPNTQTHTCQHTPHTQTHTLQTNTHLTHTCPHTPHTHAHTPLTQTHTSHTNTHMPTHPSHTCTHTPHTQTHKCPHTPHTHASTRTHTHTPTHYKTHSYTQTHISQNNIKPPQYKLRQCKIYPNGIATDHQYPQYKVTLMHIATLSTRTSPSLTSLQNKTTSHKLCPFIPHHILYLHSNPTCIPLLVTTYLTLFPNVFSLQWKDTRKLAGNWFQPLMALFMKENIPTSVLSFLVLIFRLCSPLLR